jgi:RNA polymerase sigma factor (TIGR02999 family)
MSETDPALTARLQAAAPGDPRAAEELLPLLYRELKRLAAGHMRCLPPGNTLQPTALVHEAYLRLIGDGDPGWNGRGHFFGSAARAMRDILVDQARRKAAARHGGEARRVELEDVEPVFDEPVEDLLALDIALGRLEARHPTKARLVMLRYFAGLTIAETAAIVGASERSLERDWRFVRAWLQREMANGGPTPEGGDG